MKVVEPRGDVFGEPIPEGCESWPLQEPDHRLVVTIVDPVSWFYRAISMRNVATTRIIFVVYGQGFCRQAKSIAQCKFDEWERGACPRVLEQGFDILGTLNNVKFVVQNLDSNWMWPPKELAANSQHEIKELGILSLTNNNYVLGIQDISIWPKHIAEGKAS